MGRLYVPSIYGAVLHEGARTPTIECGSWPVEAGAARALPASPASRFKALSASPALRRPATMRGSEGVYPGMCLMCSRGSPVRGEWEPSRASPAHVLAATDTASRATGRVRRPSASATADGSTALCPCSSGEKLGVPPDPDSWAGSAGSRLLGTAIQPVRDVVASSRSERLKDAVEMPFAVLPPSLCLATVAIDPTCVPAHRAWTVADGSEVAPCHVDKFGQLAVRDVTPGLSIRLKRAGAGNVGEAGRVDVGEDRAVWIEAKTFTDQSLR